MGVSANLWSNIHITIWDLKWNLTLIYNIQGAHFNRQRVYFFTTKLFHKSENTKKNATVSWQLGLQIMQSSLLLSTKLIDSVGSRRVLVVSIENSL